MPAIIGINGWFGAGKTMLAEELHQIAAAYYGQRSTERVPLNERTGMTTVLDRFRLDDKVAIVTGASSGLGGAFAKALAEAGADLVLAARRASRLEAR